MTGLSQIGGFNIGDLGGLPRNSADGAAMFDALMQKMNHGAPNFADQVRSARTSAEKRDLIDGFVAGYAAAARQNGGRPDTGNRFDTMPVRHHRPGAGHSGGVGHADRSHAPSQSQPHFKADPDIVGILQGFSTLAGKIDESDLPEETKGRMLDGIAGLIQALQNLSGGGCSDKPIHSQPMPNPGVPGSGPSRPNDGAVWSHEVKDGKATINLGDKYTVTCQEKGESWTIRNNETGKVTRISGDPHVDADGDGKDDWDFKKDMTFQLEDGTKITVNTVPAQNGTTYSSKLTITKGEHAIQVEGLAGDADGKNNLKVIQSDAGKTVDQLVNDGVQTIYEDNGNWRTRDGRRVTQQLINDGENAIYA